MPIVTVVVPVRDGAAVLPACLDALAGQTGVEAYDVVVVDNGSTDATAEVATAHPVGAQVVCEPRPGSYAARNAGIAATSAPLLAFTDADCMPAPGWLAALLRCLDAGADLVGGRVDPLPADGVVARYDRAVYLRQGDYVAEQGFAATANLAVRRDVVDRIGPFDAGLRSGGDLELCLRARAAGFSLRYAADAVVAHRPRTGLGELWRLHRRLGAGWHDLARRGLRPGPAWKDPALRWPTLGMVVEQVAADGPALRRRQLLPVHAVAMSGRWVGRLTGRG